VVPKARPMPLQSLAQRTVGRLPYGIRRPLLKLARPSSTTISQRQPRLRRVVVDAFSIMGGWPSPQCFRRFRFESNLGIRPLLQRHSAGSRGPSCFWWGPKVLPSAFWTPLLGFIKDRPSASTDAVRPLPGGPRPALRPGAAILRTRSALAVLPDYGGLLHSTPCRFVAPCIRPWGSPRFRSALALRPKARGEGSPSPVAPHPSKLSPPRQVAARHHAPIPSRRCSGFPVSSPPVLPRLGPGPSDLRSTSGFCSAAKSVAACRRCHRQAARCSLGLGPRRVLDAFPEPSLRRATDGWSRVTRRSRGGRPWLVPLWPEGRVGADRGWSRDGPWAARGPSAVVPLWSEDRAGAGRGWSLCGPKTGGRPWEPGASSSSPRAGRVGVRWLT
jgi:hypothetical protein